MTPLFKIEYIWKTNEGNVLKSAWINPDMIIAIEPVVNYNKNKSAIEMRGGGTRYDVRKPEELNMALTIHCITKK